jgi:hypothetical protein
VWEPRYLLECEICRDSRMMDEKVERDWQTDANTSPDLLFYEITTWGEMTTDFICADAVCGSWWFR